MTEQNNYVIILIDSLQKKLQVLEKIIQMNQDQMKIAQEEKFNMEAFDESITQKDDLIIQLGQLDDGFETVYERVKPELLQHKSAYAKEIQILQNLISQITDKSVIIQTAETRNKLLIEKQFKFARQEIQQARTTSRAASNFYKAMSRVNATEPMMMDEKK